MKRGSIVTIALSGDFGKPRPAVVIQADLFNQTHPTVTVLPLTGTITNAPLFRLTVTPSPENGLKKVSQIMLDKAISVRRERIGRTVGQLSDEAMIGVTRSLAVWLGIG